MDKNKPSSRLFFSANKTARAYLEKILYQTSIEVFMAGLINGYLIMILLFLLGYRVGPSTHLTLIYLIPIAAITLTAGRMNGVIAVFVATMMEFLSSHHNLPLGINSLPLIWNAVNCLVFFLVFSLLVSELKRVKISERLLSRLDPKTGLFNGKYFTELVSKEIDRGKRYNHPISILYIECENLQQTIRALGPKVGDEIIMTSATCLRRTLRSTDSLAYFGGSEFGAVLPETNGNQAAATIRRLKNQLLDCTVENLWPVNYRIGVETFTEFTQPPEMMVKQAYLHMRREKARVQAETVVTPEIAT
ncbi:MAG: diguanylate cyclase [Firmicutes bacterium]|nr:diguanylate cyclase [Bacillota bacterium]